MGCAASKKRSPSSATGLRKRRIGIRTEQQACRMLEGIFGGRWIRTTPGQRQEMGDVVPENLSVEYLVEVKYCSTCSPALIGKWWEGLRGRWAHAILLIRMRSCLWIAITTSAAAAARLQDKCLVVTPPPQWRLIHDLSE